MGHLAICDDITFPSIIESGYISGKCKINKYQVKTVADIMSSFLCVKVDDYIFPWIINRKNIKGVGFKYIFKCSGPPIYVQGDPYPFKIPIQRNYREYETALSETEALDLFRDQLLWNAIGKKSLGRPKSLSNQTEFEDTLLIHLLNEKNTSVYEEKQINETAPIIYPNAVEIGINQNQSNTRFRNVRSINNIVIANLPFRQGRFFRVEKVFEAWFIQEANNNRLTQFLALLNLNDYTFSWVGNYLPFGVAGSNIDIVCILEYDGHKIALVIELKHEGLSISNCNKESIKVTEYAEFINRAFLSFGETIEIKKIVLTGNSRNNVTPVRANSVHWIAYEYNTIGGINFLAKC